MNEAFKKDDEANSIKKWAELLLLKFSISQMKMIELWVKWNFFPSCNFQIFCVDSVFAQIDFRSYIHHIQCVEKILL